MVSSAVYAILKVRHTSITEMTFHLSGVLNNSPYTCVHSNWITMTRLLDFIIKSVWWDYPAMQSHRSLPSCEAGARGSFCLVQPASAAHNWCCGIGPKELVSSPSSALSSLVCLIRLSKSWEWMSVISWWLLLLPCSSNLHKVRFFKSDLFLPFDLFFFPFGLFFFLIHTFYSLTPSCIHSSWQGFFQRKKCVYCSKPVVQAVCLYT
jgi:hypothetical protein